MTCYFLDYLINNCNPNKFLVIKLGGFVVVLYNILIFIEKFIFEVLGDEITDHQLILFGLIGVDLVLFGHSPTFGQD